MVVAIDAKQFTEMEDGHLYAWVSDTDDAMRDCVGPTFPECSAFGSDSVDCNATDGCTSAGYCDDMNDECGGIHAPKSSCESHGCQWVDYCDGDVVQCATLHPFECSQNQFCHIG